jgi:hypothetical protein
LREEARTKIRHYRQLYINRPDPIAFMPVAVDTSGRVYDDFSLLLFLHTHREASALSNEIPEEPEQFRFLRAACYANIKGSVGLILVEASAMRISIPLDLSSRSFIPLPRFMRSRRTATLLAPSLVFTPRRFAYAALVGCCSYQLYRLFQTLHSFSVTIFTLDLRLFFNPAANKLDLRYRRCTNPGTNFNFLIGPPQQCAVEFSPRLVRRSFVDMQSQVHGFTGA